MKLMFCLLVFALTAPMAVAEWAFKSSDRPLSQSEVDDLTAGQTIVFYDDGESKYSVGGAYSYTYASGESAFGHYTIAEDGTVCVTYRNGFSRCDRYVRSGNRIVLLTEKGLRFPVRPAGIDSP